MQLTPSAKSSFIAGMGLSVIGWMTLLHVDTLADMFHLDRWIKQRKILIWIDSNKILTLLLTEFLNYGVHGITNPDSVTFAGGSTVINVLFIFLFLPLRMIGLRQAHAFKAIAPRSKDGRNKAGRKRVATQIGVSTS